MAKPDSSWSFLYLGVAAFGVFGGHMFATHGPFAFPTVFLIFGGVVCFIFTFATVFGKLWMRFGDSRDRLVLDVNLWASSLANPQSNRLAQVIFFGSIGLTAIFESRCPISQSPGFLPLAMAIGVAMGMLLFRLKYSRQLRQYSQSTGEAA